MLHFTFTISIMVKNSLKENVRFSQAEKLITQQMAEIPKALEIHSRDFDFIAVVGFF